LIYECHLETNGPLKPVEKLCILDKNFTTPC
jgi:hypothetical protein